MHKIHTILVGVVIVPLAQARRGSVWHCSEAFNIS